MYATPEYDNSFEKYDEMRLHRRKLLSASIIEFYVPLRIAIPLDNAGIRRLGDIVRLDRKGLLNIKRLGEKGADEIERLLSRLGLSLGMSLK